MKLICINKNFKFKKILIIRSIICLILSLFAINSHGDASQGHISYQIKYLNSADNPCFSIVFSAHTNESGKFLVRLPYNASNITLNADISNGKATHSRTEDPYVVQINYSPQQPFQIHYKLCSSGEKHNIQIPIIKSNFFHIVASSILATPESTMGSEWDIDIEMLNMPQEFSFISSLAIHDKHKFFKATLDDFRESVIIGGNINLEKFTVDNKQIYLVAVGTWSLFKESHIYYLQKLITTIRNFWQDHDFPQYLVVLTKDIPQDNKVKLISGIHKTNAASLLFPDGPADKLPKVLWVLSHELFHAWLGIKMKFPLPQGEQQWFLEGFDDYYGLLLTLKSGVISLPEYITLFNFILKSYNLIPVNSATKEKIINNFKLGNDYALMLHFQGHLLASELAAKTKTNSNLASMDELMRNIFKDFKQRGDVFLTADHLEAAFNQHFGEEWQSQKNSLDQGKIIVPSANALGPCVELETIEVEKPEFGFDVIKLAESNTVQGLKLNSNAYRAGIREGQEVVNYFLSYNDADDPAEIVIKENDSNRTINFYPEKTTASVPQYKLNQEKFSKNKQLCLSYFE